MASIPRRGIHLLIKDPEPAALFLGSKPEGPSATAKGKRWGQEKIAVPALQTQQCRLSKSS